MPLIRVAPSAISGNNAWGMVPSSWRVPGDLDNHGRYHFYFPLSILVHPDDDHPNPISASRYPQRPSTQTLRRSGGLSLRLRCPRGACDGRNPDRRLDLERFSIAWMPNLAQRRGTRRTPLCPPFARGEKRPDAADFPPLAKGG